MKNPFIKVNDYTKSEFVSSSCSLNKGVVAKLPINGVDDSVEGLHFNQIFSTGLIVDEIKLKANEFNIDISTYKDSYLPQYLEIALSSDEIKDKQLANEIIEKFGNRLGLIFLTLRTGLKENRIARSDWEDKHWEYWNNLKNIILVGGLASGILGRRFKEQVFYVFDRANVEAYDITLFDNGTYVGILGSANLLMKDNSTSLVFDLGHTNIKRCVVTKEISRVISLVTLDSLPSPYMNNVYDSTNDRYEDAVLLHRFLVNMIASTYKDRSKIMTLSDEIIISIANYNSKGVLNSVRGGYSKLSMLSNDYELLLSDEISGELHKNVRIKLLHDGTANALYFSEIRDSVCISLGTSFGVGFPDINIT